MTATVAAAVLAVGVGASASTSGVLPWSSGVQVDANATDPFTAVWLGTTAGSYAFSDRAAPGVFVQTIQPLQSPPVNLATANATGVAASPDGNVVYFTDSNTSSIQAFDLMTHTQHTVLTLAATIPVAIGVYDNNGVPDLWYADDSQNMYEDPGAATVATPVDSSSAVGFAAAYVTQIAFDPNGTSALPYVATTTGIYTFDLGFSEQVGNINDIVTALAFDSNSNLYYTDLSTNTVDEALAAESYTTHHVLPNQSNLGGANGIAVNPAGTTMVVGNQGSGENLFTALTPQTITFPALSDVTVGSSQSLAATSNSGLAVTYSDSTPSVCTLANVPNVRRQGIHPNTPANPSVSADAPGTCTVVANQIGDGTYAAADPVTVSFTVSAALSGQTITFPALTDLTVGGSQPLAATSTSGLPVAYSVTTPTVCSVLNGTVTADAAGMCTVTAGQGGGSGYAAAAPVSQSFAVSEVQSPVVADGSVTLTGGTSRAVTVAVTDPGNFPVTLTVDGGNADVQASVSGDLVTVSAARGFSGTADLTVTADNGHGGVATATLHVTVQPAPVHGVTWTVHNGVTTVVWKASPTQGVTYTVSVPGAVLTTRDTQLTVPFLVHEGGRITVAVLGTGNTVSDTVVGHRVGGVYDTVRFGFGVGGARLTASLLTLATRLHASGYTHVTVTGYARPAKGRTVDNGDTDLALSRAQQVAKVLRAAGVTATVQGVLVPHHASNDEAQRADISID